MALGATRGDVEALIFRQGFLSAAVGLGIGLGSTLVVMRLIGGVLPGLNYGNFGHIGIEVGFVALTAAIACWLPARRAAKIDPMAALRQE
jgi:ABC-type antimicrobial peptide transport system permease subunit